MLTDPFKLILDPEKDKSAGGHRMEYYCFNVGVKWVCWTRGGGGEREEIKRWGVSREEGMRGWLEGQT